MQADLIDTSNFAVDCMHLSDPCPRLFGHIPYCERHEIKKTVSPIVLVGQSDLRVPYALSGFTTNNSIQLIINCVELFIQHVLNYLYNDLCKEELNK